MHSAASKICLGNSITILVMHVLLPHWAASSFPPHTVRGGCNYGNLFSPFFHAPGNVLLRFPVHIYITSIHMKFSEVQK
ncbi:hypothetical protein EV421DRAFT_1782261 [Armillaria borealis]|uniref:Secreted protein n=1 Tax=Armillaria borealis TaxID=47425 RepID=A0AA39JX78_9AGAR|nr:hypothetical protein EV421DRAFT_1782261 [Armillaria borealis]